MTMTSPSNMLWDLLQVQPHDEGSIMQCLYDHPTCCSLVGDDKLAIHTAIEQCLSMVIIKQMLVCYPACCSRKNSKGYLLLHELLLSKDHPISSNVIFLIIDANVEAVRTVDIHGNLPIHSECINRCRFDVVIKLLNIYSDAINTMCDYGYYPLHCAIISDHSSYEVISYLIDAYPDAVHKPHYVGELPLHMECIKHCRSAIIVKLLNIYPDAVGIVGEYGCPLHDALFSDHNSPETIIHLIDAYPDAVRAKDCNGDFPLHKECSDKCRYDVVIKQLEIYPDAISIVGGRGQFPLHCALTSDHSSFEVISYLIDAYPDAVRIPYSDGDLLLHMECQKYCRYDVIVKLLKFYPDAINIVGDHGYYPLHCALKSDRNSYEVISYLAMLHPDAVHIRDSEGNLPLYTECSTKCRYDVIKMSYDAYPAAVAMRDRVSFMPVCHVFSTYYGSYMDHTTTYSSKQSMQYKALVTTMIDTCYSDHAVYNSFNNMDFYYIQLVNYPIQYRLLLNLAAHHLRPSAWSLKCMRNYHDKNYQPRAYLLHHVYQLSISNPMWPFTSTTNDMYDGSLCGMLLSMLATAGRLHMTHDSMYDHVVDMKYGWMKGDDIGCVLLRKVVFYL